MIIDCDECAVRGPACADCVVTVLLGGPPDEVLGDPARPAHGRRPAPYVLEPGLVDLEPERYGLEPGLVDLDETERWAVGNLAAAGLVPPLRMVSLREENSTQRDRALTHRRRSAG